MVQWQPELMENREPRCRIEDPMVVFPHNLALSLTLTLLERELQPCGRRRNPSVASIRGVGLGKMNAPLQGATVLSLLVTTRRSFRSPQGRPPFRPISRGTRRFRAGLDECGCSVYFVHTKYVLLASQLRLPRACWMDT